LHQLPNYNPPPTDSFDETIGLTTLSDTYTFALYRDKGTSTNTSWISVSNPTGASVDVNIEIGGVNKGPYTIPANSKINKNYPGLTDGPVVITSTEGEDIVASMRQKENGHFDEVIGATSLLDVNYLALYRDKGTGKDSGWISISNPTNSAVDVNVKIGSTTYGPYTIPVNGKINKNYPGLVDGPLVVSSTGGELIIMSLRQKENYTFDESVGGGL